jgi:hypothetical protein
MPNVNPGPGLNSTPSLQGALNSNSGDPALLWNAVGPLWANISLRVQTAPNGTIIYPSAAYDQINHANTQSAGTLTVNSPLGLASDGQRMTFRITTANVQTYSWGGAFHGSTTAPLPSSSSGGGEHDYIGFIYNASTAQWDYVSTVAGF